MVTPITSPEVEIEEELVAVLSRLGIRYLSRLSKASQSRVHPPSILIAELSGQPSSRVRAALIPLFLTHPEYARAVPGAIKSAGPKQTVLIKIFYTAAVILQKKYINLLQAKLKLSDLFSEELGISSSSIDEQLSQLGKIHQQVSGQFINWQGSYENAARHLFRQWEAEKRWNKSPQRP